MIMKHYLIVTDNDGIRSRSILTHRLDLSSALADVARSTRPSVKVVAAYDVTAAYDANDHAGMFPATRDDMTSDLPNLLATDHKITVYPVADLGCGCYELSVSCLCGWRYDGYTVASMGYAINGHFRSRNA